MLAVLRHILLAAIIATVVVWVVTQWYDFVFTHTDFFVSIGGGSFFLIYSAGWPTWSCSCGVGLGYHMHKLSSGNPIVSPYLDAESVIIPFWLILAVLLPPWWLMGRKSRQRKRWAKEGCCLSCGYNLQGSESGTCSECGAGYGQANV